MRSAERISKAAFELARHLPYDKITYADIAKEAGVHWTTVQRYFGSKEEMRKILLEEQTQLGDSLADTRTKILEAARRVFAKYGYEGATLDQVANDAGLTKGAVYWHFSSKSDLYLALCERSLTQLLQGLPDQIQNIFNAPNPMEALRTLLESQFSSCEERNGEQPMLFFEFISSSRDPSVREKLCEAFSKLFQGTSDSLQEMQQKRLLTSDVDSHDLSVVLHSLINGIVLMWIVAPNHVSFQSASEAVSKILWHGIQPNEQEKENHP
ncbi:TetR/AcrR family transcriptional regulator [Melghirimyces algeriensis]|uniref:Transcriptional regulator, TetR family n=1 Tax=Melghirimyces algeriensis TaxID=910412 RepID=A0A521E736_9BACL|nr:TetR/AcrR family transcriptional regulator [Melghirimyces algeriensis]SMO79756.1 transcriptional regulator, TetR family [Melghirimyces algeriensis]